MPRLQVASEHGLVSEEAVLNARLLSVARLLLPLPSPDLANPLKRRFTLRQQIRAVLEWAVAMEFRIDNPCDRIRPVLGPQRDIVQHMRALPHREVPAAIRTVQASTGAPGVRLAFEFLVLTAARWGEVRWVEWAEIDRNEGVWTVPAQRAKANRQHRVPLCGRALEILDAARALGDGASPLVFTGRPGSRSTRSSCAGWDVEDLLTERGLDISYGSVRRWFLKFGAPIARNLRHTRPIPNGYWHLDERVIVIRGQRYWLWRGVDNEGEVLDFLVQSKRNSQAALKLMRKLLKKQGWTPTRITTDKLRSYHVAIRTLGLTAQHIDDRRANNRAENSHQPVRRRERKQQRFKSPGSAQRFLNIQSAVYNTFYVQRHLRNRFTFKRFRKDAFNVWESASAAA